MLLILRYSTHFLTGHCNEIWSGLTSLCKKCDDIIKCAESGHHLRQDRTEPGTPYFGKSLPVRPLSLPEFLWWSLLSRRLWFVVCFGKLSLSDIPILNNQAASDRASAVAEVPSKWRGRRKKDWISAMLACEVCDVVPSCWKYPVESFSSSNWFTKALKISIYSAVVMVASKKMGPIMRRRDIPHISHTTNVLLLKFRCNIFIGVRIIKEMPGSVASGTPCKKPRCRLAVLLITS